MKIYQIHELSGEWEDRYDCIVASYLSKEKAYAEKERLEKEIAEEPKCNECILYFCPSECSFDCVSGECKEHAINEIKKRCKEYEPINEENKDRCKNFDYNSYYDTFYKIEEVEVIE